MLTAIGVENLDMRIKTSCAVRYSFALLAALAVGGCSSYERESTVGPSSTGTSPLLGTWSSSSAVPSPTACTDFRWSVTEQSGTSASGSFSATCPGGIAVNGSASGTLTGAVVSWAAQGTASVPNLPSCAITLTGTAELAGDSIRVPYAGDTCLGRVTGVEVLRKN
jgi:hypothetical protein